tara:strand:+ start:4429 stop:5166 length:738 start_codon:yes stop_codon:yes gene_type:complete
MMHKKIRIAKLLANYNQGSRRRIEELIKNNKVIVNKHTINSPITFVNTDDEIFVNNRKVKFEKKLKVFKFYKPKNIICSKAKQDNKDIIYDIIPKKFKNFIFAGRLDYNSEGLMILTNSSKITRTLELPKNKFPRTYQVRVYGDCNLKNIKEKSKGSIINGKKYLPFRFVLNSKIKKNTNLEITLFEGKKNEIKEIFKSIKLQVNKLKRVKYGPFCLNRMKPLDIKEITNSEFKEYENYIRKQKG